MKKGFNFERNLPHQIKAVESINNIFKGMEVSNKELPYQNNIIHFDEFILNKNKNDIQQFNDLENTFLDDDKIFDIHMETGTGKTYTYTKTIFELNKNLGLNKFIIVVPTLSIKAGTVNFLRSKAVNEHFIQDYAKRMNVFVVDSKETKSKKQTMPQSISNFLRANDLNTNINILVINSGMINSKTIRNVIYDTNIIDKYNNPLKGIRAIKPITIIDEPHKFPDTGKTFKNLLDFNSQFIIRYGATFKDSKNNDTFKNLLYSLNSIQAFNNDLVKGITAYVEEYKDGDNTSIKLLNTDGKEAEFELNNNGSKSKYKLSKSDYLDMIHNNIQNLGIEKMNQSKVVLNNGLELKKGDKINPYSYSDTMQNKMLSHAVKKHFELERKYLTREVRIKPLSLFFIDDIKSYRNDDNSNGAMANYFEQLVEQEIKKILVNETNERYIKYLEHTLKDLRSVHGGYFSKDNTGKDDKVEREINEILHDKEALLDLENPRRFIFSKWTLKEGWDNPNVFQICKLRSSGSETSKLQEVGRGLRIPVNEFMEREKDEQFELHYHVDFTERDFVEKLVGEINSNVIQKVDESKLDEIIINRLLNDYSHEFENEEALLEKLDELNIINRKNEYKENGLKTLKEEYPLSFDILKNNKVKLETEKSDKVTIRKENYNKLKLLWEEINKKVILEYDFKNEEHVLNLLFESLKDVKFYNSNVITNKFNINVKNTATIDKQEPIINNEYTISNMKYGEFLRQLSQVIMVHITTIHNTFIKLYTEVGLDINKFLNHETIRVIKQEFNNYLIEQSFSKFNISYNNVSTSVHPTTLTNGDGTVKTEIEAGNVGIKHIEGAKPVDSYLFNELYYDSELEKDNIEEVIKDVVVFAKIPKNSVKIPVVGGYTYSPDFAYVIEYENGKKQLNLVVETKNKHNKDLSKDEEMKIKSAEKLFNSNFIDVKFRRQMTNDKIIQLLNELK